MLTRDRIVSAVQTYVELVAAHRTDGLQERFDHGPPDVNAVIE